MKPAVFVMEMALRKEIPTYSGGLGILAGDFAISLAEKGVPAVFVTLVYKKGYTSQKLDRHFGQLDSEVSFDPARFLSPLTKRVQVEILNRSVWVEAWEYRIKGKTEVPVLFLDTDLPDNDEEARRITDRLYGGDLWHRLIQEMVLGIGGYRMLKALGIDSDIYHMNEGHSAFVTTELLREFKDDVAEVRKRCVFTTHTSVPAGFDIFPLSMVKRAFESYHWINWDAESEDGRLNMSRLALRYSGMTNAVSLKHRYLSESVLNHKGLEYVTNGVNQRRWVHAELKKVYDRHLAGWEGTPAILGGALSIPSEELAGAHAAAKAEMFGMVRDRTGIQLEPDALTIVQAKRLAGYKHNNLILREIEKLTEIAATQGSIQLIFSGKAHPADDIGKGMLKDILTKADELTRSTDRVKVVFLEDYDIDTAKLLVSGCDVWLNNPKRPFEASGTSGMKAAMNGVLNFSGLDGWWLEGGMDGVNGWSIGKRVPGTTSPPSPPSLKTCRRSTEGSTPISSPHSTKTRTAGGRWRSGP